MNSKVLEFTVGLFILAGIAALGYLALGVGNMGTLSGGETYRVSARFDNIGGLAVKAPVTLAGVKIGRVSRIVVDPELFRAEVTMEIDAAYDNLPLDSGASILTSGLLGAQYIELDPGGDIEFLKDGSRIDITQSAVVLEHLISQFFFSQNKE
ncbi:MAG: outer membrane lipid asymmetry maintenance protein MlaD [marine bacterium B5-7]|nr:MAG: outer membrane lipid asymmetry maintenance protein MlaD [marine bacterium B5-7]